MTAWLRRRRARMIEERLWALTRELFRYDEPLRIYTMRGDGTITYEHLRRMILDVAERRTLL